MAAFTGMSEARSSEKSRQARLGAMKAKIAFPVAEILDRAGDHN